MKLAKYSSHHCVCGGGLVFVVRRCGDSPVTNFAVVVITFAVDVLWSEISFACMSACQNCVCVGKVITCINRSVTSQRN